MSDVEIRIEGKAGRITLNRPKALNAVTWEMLTAIDAALDAWENDSAVSLVVIDAAGDRAFAAGGDIVDLYNTGKSGDVAFGRRFWAEEYRLNARIASYPKPYVALMHGFVMGGGVGVSCHGSHRIVDESAQIAMPECGIGLIPDVGGSWLLARAPAGLGEMVGLTGHRMGPADAIFMGFADHFVPRADWPALTEALVHTGDVSAITALAQPGPQAALGETNPDLDTAAVWSNSTIGAIVAELLANGSDTSQTQLKTLRKQSPLSVACGLCAIQAARSMTLDQALAQEYRYVWRCMTQGDFLEGIRAQVIDKDRNPHWLHDAAENVTATEVAAMLAPLGADELVI